MAFSDLSAVILDLIVVILLHLFAVMVPYLFAAMGLYLFAVMPLHLVAVTLVTLVMFVMLVDLTAVNLVAVMLLDSFAVILDSISRPWSYFQSFCSFFPFSAAWVFYSFVLRPAPPAPPPPPPPLARYAFASLLVAEWYSLSPVLPLERFRGPENFAEERRPAPLGSMPFAALIAERFAHRPRLFHHAFDPVFLTD